ncbi:MAG TPA: response regulator transcription factor [Chloroflexi bacterium]|jgi:DNA-binding NarL/FixJ family response regulator|nr:response regulator transcription factor [Chloroflexota bacterium]
MNLLIADQYALFREGLASLLSQESDIHVVGQASSGAEMVALAVELSPDVVLMDADFSDGSGLLFMKSVLSRQPRTQFIVLSHQFTNERFLEAILAGARGFLRKTISAEMLIAALRAVERGEAVIPRKLVSTLLDELNRVGTLFTPNQQNIASLTYRECEVLNLLGVNYSNREIANQLIISENTVRVHVHNILEKLNLKNRREAAEFANRYQLSL